VFYHLQNQSLHHNCWNYQNSLHFLKIFYCHNYYGFLNLLDNSMVFSLVTGFSSLCCYYFDFLILLLSLFLRLNCRFFCGMSVRNIYVTITFIIILLLYLFFLMLLKLEGFLFNFEVLFTHALVISTNPHLLQELQ